ncbi:MULTISPECIES: DUF3120 domain-containing protein [Kamptonema]|uniref:DUF3120 domain-containing protein n=1 Tax=Kamptonema TaxID=1501433 RepID=UPI0001DAC99A|nr:DUF3120 domain-containing protein [Kamptonema sp. PCC 6506]CBN56243.1 conserved membrane hypothetical protein [Kamptonema sp. PCC 6506]
MFNETLSEFTSTAASDRDSHFSTFFLGKLRFSTTWLIFGAAVFLVTVPVFFQAPLVRQMPVVSLTMTVGWLAIAFKLLKNPSTWLWGDLLLGFTWSWLTGGIYWGWLRWEPLWHLPVEGALVPLAIWCLRREWGKVGNWFYLGSLFGTAVTDGYFYLTGLIPHWRQLMQVDISLAMPIFQSAIAVVRTPWGVSCAIFLVGVLLTVGLFPLRFGKPHWWAFSGAVLGTILVDSLFLLAASVN